MFLWSTPLDYARSTRAARLDLGLTTSDILGYIEAHAEDPWFSAMSDRTLEQLGVAQRDMKVRRSALPAKIRGRKKPPALCSACFGRDCALAYQAL